MAVWRLTGNHLTCISFQKYESQKVSLESIDPLKAVLVSLDFLNYKLGYEI
jgi:hypothetical protein